MRQVENRGLGPNELLFPLLRGLYPYIRETAKVLVDRIPVLRSVLRQLVRVALGGKGDVCEGRLNGHLFLAPLDFAGFFFVGEYEPETATAFLECIRPGDIVIDVGSYIGVYALLAARCVGADGKVICFEPDPKNFELLTRNIKTNGYSNIEPVMSAISDEKGAGLLHGRGSSTWSLVERKKAKAPEEERVCLTTSIDEYFRETQVDKSRVGAVKIDVEGFEMKVLRGMSSLINSPQPLTVVCEINPSLLGAAGTQPTDILDLLEGHGFDVRSSTAQGSHGVLEEIGGLRPGSGVNVIFRRPVG